LQAAAPLYELLLWIEFVPFLFLVLAFLLPEPVKKNASGKENGKSTMKNCMTKIQDSSEYRGASANKKTG